MILRDALGVLTAVLGPIGAIGCGSAADSTTEGEPQPVAQPVAASSGISESDDCTTVREWVEAHRGTLPSTYEDVSRFPMQYRKGIFSAHSPRVKSSLWNGHISRYIAVHSSITLEQSSVLDKTMRFLSEELYRSSGELPQDAAEMVQRIMDEAADAFGVDEAGLILTQLGDVDSSNELKPLEHPFCNCSMQSDQCWIQGNYTCRFGVVSCLWLSSGCGLGWLSSCNGFCMGD